MKNSLLLLALCALETCFAMQPNKEKQRAEEILLAKECARHRGCTNREKQMIQDTFYDELISQDGGVQVEVHRGCLWWLCKWCR